MSEPSPGFTYIFASKNSSATMIISALTKDDAWAELEDKVGTEHDFRLSEGVGE